MVSRSRGCFCAPCCCCPCGCSSCVQRATQTVLIGFCALAAAQEARTGQLVAEKRRSPFLLLSACLTLPLSWVLGRVAVLDVLEHDCLVGQQQQQQQGCNATPSWWQWRSFVSVSSWAAVAAHPGNFGLVAAVLLPSLLAVLLVVGMVAQTKSDRRSMPLAVVLRLAGDAGSACAATLFLAVARLLPMARSMLVLLTRWVGLRQQYPAGQALQLLQPATAVLSGIMTLLSQVRGCVRVAATEPLRRVSRRCVKTVSMLTTLKALQWYSVALHVV